MVFGMIIRIGCLVVSKNIDPSNPYVYAVTLKDFKPNTLLIARSKSYNHWKIFIEQFKLSNVYFESQKLKKITQDVMKLYIA